jgi:hypothetical protein
LLWEKERKEEKKVVKVVPVGGIDQAQAGERLDTSSSVKTSGLAVVVVSSELSQV